MRAAGRALALLFLAVVAIPAAVANDLYLTDPTTGREVRVDSGAALVHLVFFATWCPDCLDELDALTDLADRWTDRGYGLVLVAVPERQTPDRLRRFAENRRPPGRVLFDVDGTFAQRLNVGRVPTHVLLDTAGEEIGRYNDVDAAAKAVAERLGGSDG